MRVVAGELGGRRLVAPRGWSVRPTSDRVREAIFSALGDIEGARVLDLYCGTGALGVEAISRGAEAATLVDRDVRAALGNVRNLGLNDRIDLVRANVVDWLKSRATSNEERIPSFDLIFLDPPYKLADRLGPELDPHLPGHLAEGGRVIAECAARRPLELSLPLLRERRYGGTLVTFHGAPEEQR
ncbi:MAG: RsmD family RNA methyltransferase [Actinomycetota bacterium]|nr:RsmD family RNA methyltransferase [Actinomycetota bacterium]